MALIRETPDDSNAGFFECLSVGDHIWQVCIRADHNICAADPKKLPAESRRAVGGHSRSLLQPENGRYSVRSIAATVGLARMSRCRQDQQLALGRPFLTLGDTGGVI